MTRIRWLSHIPKSKFSLYWPCKMATIPEAVRWFRKEHGVVPELVVSKDMHWGVVQDVSMWAEKAPTPIHQHLVKTHGRVLGDVKYKEQLRFWAHEKRKSKRM